MKRKATIVIVGWLLCPLAASSIVLGLQGERDAQRPGLEKAEKPETEEPETEEPEQEKPPVVETVQVTGTVVDRDGKPQARCRVEFKKTDTSTTYTVWTNSEGVFFLDSPARGNYDVTVTQGKWTQLFDVVVGSDRLAPDLLVVDW